MHTIESLTYAVSKSPTAIETYYTLFQRKETLYPRPLPSIKYNKKDRALQATHTYAETLSKATHSKNYRL